MKSCWRVRADVATAAACHRRRPNSYEYFMALPEMISFTLNMLPFCKLKSEIILEEERALNINENKLYFK